MWPLVLPYLDDDCLGMVANCCRSLHELVRLYYSRVVVRVTINESIIDTMGRSYSGSPTKGENWPWIELHVSGYHNRARRNVLSPHNSPIRSWQAKSRRGLFSLLLHTPKLELLDMESCSLDKLGLLALRDSLPLLKLLRCLRLSDNRIGPEGMLVLSEGRRHLRGLHQLRLNHVQLGVRGVTGPLCEVLVHLPLLEELEVGLNEMEIEGFTALCSCLPKLPKLRHLDVSENKLHDAEGMSLLSEQFQRIRSLTSLSVSGNSIGNDGLVSLCCNIACLSSLQALDLSYNGIGSQGIEMLSASLPHVPKLAILTLAYNSVGYDGISSLCSQWHHLQGLRVLDLRCNRIRRRGMFTLATNLSRLPSLKVLNVDAVPFRQLDPSILSLRPFFAQPRSVIADCKDPHFTSHFLDSWVDLMRYLSRNRSEQMNCVRMMMLGATAVGKTALVEILRSRESLTHSLHHIPTWTSCCAEILGNIVEDEFEDDGMEWHTESVETNFFRLEDRSWQVLDLGGSTTANPIHRHVFNTLATVYLIVVSLAEGVEATPGEQVDRWLTFLQQQTDLRQLYQEDDSMALLPLSRVIVVITHIDAAAHPAACARKLCKLQDELRLRHEVLNKEVLTRRYGIPIDDVFWLNYDFADERFHQLVSYLCTAWDMLHQKLRVWPETLSVLTKIRAWVQACEHQYFTRPFSLAEFRVELNVPDNLLDASLIDSLEYLHFLGMILFNRQTGEVSITPVWLLPEQDRGDIEDDDRSAPM
jgi:Ran GTPase-activating protein (RanGAP) involved in mRNA processing and transport